mgnify:CR=1 FL=1
MRIVCNYSVNLFLLLLAVDCFFFHCYHATCDSVTVVSDGCLATCNGVTEKYIVTAVLISSFSFKLCFFFKTLSEMQDKRVHPNKKVFLTLLNSLSKRGHHGLIREVCTLNVECLVKMASIYIFFDKSWKSGGKNN